MATFSSSSYNDADYSIQWEVLSERQEDTDTDIVVDNCKQCCDQAKALKFFTGAQRAENCKVACDSEECGNGFACRTGENYIAGIETPFKVDGNGLLVASTCDLSTGTAIQRLSPNETPFPTTFVPTPTPTTLTPSTSPTTQSPTISPVTNPTINPTISPTTTNPIETKSPTTTITTSFPTATPTLTPTTLTSTPTIELERTESPTRTTLLGREEDHLDALDIPALLQSPYGIGVMCLLCLICCSFICVIAFLCRSACTKTEEEKHLERVRRKKREKLWRKNNPPKKVEDNDFDQAGVLREGLGISRALRGATWRRTENVLSFNPKIAFVKRNFPLQTRADMAIPMPPGYIKRDSFTMSSRDPEFGLDDDNDNDDDSDDDDIEDFGADLKDKRSLKVAKRGLGRSADAHTRTKRRTANTQSNTELGTFSDKDTKSKRIGKQLDVAHVQLCRPLKGNAMNGRFFDDFTRTFRDLAKDTSCRAIVVSGQGKYFCVGLDLKDSSNPITKFMIDSNQRDATKDSARKSMAMFNMIGDLQQVVNCMEECPQPVIFCMHSFVIGGAMNLASGADIRMCSQDANFSVKEVDIGIAADLGALQRLERITHSSSLVRELCFTGRNMDSAEALKCGFVSKVCKDREDCLNCGMALADLIAQKSPVAVAGTKKVLNFSRDHSIATSLEFQKAWNAAMNLTDDVKVAAMSVMTKAKEPPKFAKL